MPAQVRPEHAGHGHGVRRDHMDLQPARAKGRGGLKTDEARADHRHAAGGLRGRHDAAGIRKGAERVDIGTFETRSVQPDRFGAGGQQ